MEYVVINEKDNVKVCLEDGHKYAIKPILKGEEVIKYGYPIGVATCDISVGEKVHSHNLKTLLSGTKQYEYKPHKKEKTAESEFPLPKIKVYRRKNGEVGIRNDIWIIPTVGCVNKVAEKIAEKTGAFAFTHPYGCSQLGDDLLITQKILCSLIKHPNTGGVLVLGLGCENNNIDELKSRLGEYDGERVRFLNCQDVSDDIGEGKKIISELQKTASLDKRTEADFNELKLGLKCGGSDGLSGITANPLCGKVTDVLTSAGGIAVLSEVPEMFGAEQILMSRCESREIFDKTVDLINDCKSYFIAHGCPVSENPSPGNKEGGITTLEEKSLGCVQKGGTAVVSDVLGYGDTAKKAGLNLLNGPGNDIVAVTLLTAAGCHLILFTTGRGTPLGAPVPTIKIATNSALAHKKSAWTDFDAQQHGLPELICMIADIANGKQTKNEINGYREIAIFKDGATL